jgi:hypothetical protein
VNRADRRAIASTRARRPSMGRNRRIALLNARTNDALDAWSSHVETTLSTDAIVMLIDRGMRGPLEILVTTQAAAIRLLERKAAGQPQALAKLRTPLPEPQVRCVVEAAGGFDVFDLPIV